MTTPRVSTRVVIPVQAGIQFMFPRASTGAVILARVGIPNRASFDSTDQRAD